MAIEHEPERPNPDRQRQPEAGNNGQGRDTGASLERLKSNSELNGSDNPFGRAMRDPRLNGIFVPPQTEKKDTSPTAAEARNADEQPTNEAPTRDTGRQEEVPGKDLVLFDSTTTTPVDIDRSDPVEAEIVTTKTNTADTPVQKVQRGETVDGTVEVEVQDSRLGEAVGPLVPENVAKLIGIQSEADSPTTKGNETDAQIVPDATQQEIPLRETPGDPETKATPLTQVPENETTSPAENPQPLRRDNPPIAESTQPAEPARPSPAVELSDGRQAPTEKPPAESGESEPPKQDPESGNETEDPSLLSDSRPDRSTFTETKRTRREKAYKILRIGKKIGKATFAAGATVGAAADAAADLVFRNHNASEPVELKGKGLYRLFGYKRYSVIINGRTVKVLAKTAENAKKMVEGKGIHKLRKLSNWRAKH